MVLSNGMSALVATVLAGGVFSGMQLNRHVLASSGPLTILGGGLGALLFLFILTAVGNFELMVFGRGYQIGLFPEVASCLVLALFTAGRIHGVCLTTCFIFSSVALYYVQRISQKAFAVPQQAAAGHFHKKK